MQYIYHKPTNKCYEVFSVVTNNEKVCFLCIDPETDDFVMFNFEECKYVRHNKNAKIVG